MTRVALARGVRDPARVVAHALAQRSRRAGARGIENEKLAPRSGGGIAIVPEAPQEGDLRSERLFVDDHVCILREGHPLAVKRWTAQRFVEPEHILVAPRGMSDRGVVDVLLEKRGLRRRVTRIVTSFSLALPLIAQSDRVTVLPRSFADAARALLWSRTSAAARRDAAGRDVAGVIRPQRG